jgi:mitochondrial fission protein ELM1
MNALPRTASPPSGLTCWVLSEGMAGTENQCLALATALGLEPEVKRAVTAAPWRWLKGAMTGLPPSLTAHGRDPLAPPWPDLLIASGRKCVGLALAIRRASRGKCFTVFVQNPRWGGNDFDLIVAPRHDNIVGANIFHTRGALSRVDAPRLAAAAEHFKSTFEHLSRPLVACLIGGASRRHRLTPAGARIMGTALAKFAAESGAGFLITASRRTAPESFAAFEAALADTPTFIWRGKGENPYLGFLALADGILVTADSVSMVSDACATGKPVHILPMEGRQPAQFKRFFAALQDEGTAHPFTGTLPPANYTALNDCALAAAEIARRMAARNISNGDA